jgi:hypothetical protein
LEAILELQNILIKNYYKDFILSISDENINFQSYYSELIEYRNEEYIEKKIETIEKEINYIIDDLKPVYIKSLSEVLLKLSVLPNPSEKINYLNHIIKLFKIPLTQLRKDFYINETDSRYYSEPSKAENIVSTDKVVEIIMQDLQVDDNDIEKKSYSEIEFSDFDLYELEYSNIRMQVLSKLPFSLFTITSGLINILQHKIDAINEELQDEQAVKEKIEWCGKPSQLGFLISKLAELDYLVPPKKEDGETNYTQFAKKVLHIFKIKTTEGTLATYLNSNTNKAQETHRTFEKAKFNIPHKKEVS